MRIVAEKLKLNLERFLQSFMLVFISKKYCFIKEFGIFKHKVRSSNTLYDSSAYHIHSFPWFEGALADSFRKQWASNLAEQEKNSKPP